MPPALDVSDALLDPDFNDTFLVRRRTETVGNDGFPTIVNADTPGVYGVVTAGDANELVQLADGEYAQESIAIVTQFVLQGPSPGPTPGTTIKPDLIQWAGNWYEVTSVLGYTRFGPGFVEVKAGSTQVQDEPS